MADLAGAELLAFCRRDSFNKDVEQQIAFCVDSFVDQLPLEPSRTAIPVRQSTETLDQLWVLRSLFIEIQSLQEMGELLSTLKAIDKLKVANLEFAAQNPGALVCSDIEARIENSYHQVLERTRELWNKELRVQLSPPGIHVEPTFNDHWELYDACEAHLKLKSSFMEDLGPLLEQLVELKVTEIDETETSISMKQGSTESVEMLVDNVQNFFLAFSSLCPPQLYSTAASRYGHSFVKDLTAKSLPNLSPTDFKDLSGFRSEIQGVKGLQELLTSVGWSDTHILSDYADNFQSIWTAQREAVYLDELRQSLSGKYQADSWDWDGEDWDDQEEQEANEEQAADTKEHDPPAVIISKFEKCTQDGNIDNFLGLFRALAPRYYGDHLIELYASTRDLLAAVSAYAYSAEAYGKLDSFCAQQLDSALDLLAQNVERVSKAPPSAETAQRVISEVQKSAEKANAAGPEVRDHILGLLVEQVAANTISDTLVLGDITQDQSDQISAYIKGLRGLGGFFNVISDTVPSWIKLQRLQQVLEQNLVGIAGMYENSMLADFTDEELVRLVEALFVDSELREDVLKQIR